MSNMSYCRFQNTVKDLVDCYKHINDELSLDEEIDARNQLLIVCRQIVEETEDPKNVYKIN